MQVWTPLADVPVYSHLHSINGWSCPCRPLHSPRWLFFWGGNRGAGSLLKPVSLSLPPTLSWYSLPIGHFKREENVFSLSRLQFCLEMHTSTYIPTQEKGIFTSQYPPHYGKCMLPLSAWVEKSDTPPKHPFLHHYRKLLLFADHGQIRYTYLIS